MNYFGWIVQILLVIICFMNWEPLAIISCGFVSSLSIYISVFENDKKLLIVSGLNTCLMIIGGFIYINLVT